MVLWSLVAVVLVTGGLTLVVGATVFLGIGGTVIAGLSNSRGERGRRDGDPRRPRPPGRTAGDHGPTRKGRPAEGPRKTSPLRSSVRALVR